VISRALILAAGRGVRVAEPGVPNCLARVGRSTLLRRTLQVLGRAGVRRVGITIGWRGELVRRAVSDERALLESLSLEVSFFENPDWDGPNGLSVLVARDFVCERSLLVMADQIAAPALVESLARMPAHGDATILCVDRDLARVFDMDDATKVAIEDGAVAPARDPSASSPGSRPPRSSEPGAQPTGRVRAIGKDLAHPQAVSVGLFVMSPGLLAALDGLARPSLTEGVQVAARAGQVLAYDIGTRLWQDVDSPQMRLHADWLLRVYGDELAEPGAVAAQPAPSAADDTMALVERLLTLKDEPGHVLFNPGPVMTSARVKASLVHHDVCHRDADYSGVVQRLQDKLRPVFGASPQHELLLLTGSGTAAMEMAIASSLPVGRRLLVVSNGAFGERLAEIAALHGIPHTVLRIPWGQLPDPLDVARAIDASPDVAAVAMIHHETSVGLLNPVGAVGQICRERDRLLIVDAVSALGAEDVDVVRDGVGIGFSSSNKCLHAISGVSFLCVAPEVWTRMEGVAPRVYYLDALRYRRYQQAWLQTPFTPAVSTFFALETALDELAERGGVPARREQYRKRNLRIRRVLTDLGFESFTNTGRESLTISTLRLPDGLTVRHLYDHLKARGFVIYGCKGALAERHIQVANMGELPDATVDAFLAAATEVVSSALKVRPRDPERDPEDDGGPAPGRGPEPRARRAAGSGSGSHLP
jgi:2-aminoethylphosphonate-pyruvate transaminase